MTVRAAAAVTAVVSALVVLAAAHAAGAEELRSFSFELTLTVPRLLVFGALASAGALWFALPASDGSSRALRLVNAFLLGLVSLEVLAALQERLHRREMNIWPLEIALFAVPPAVWLLTALRGWPVGPGRRLYAFGAVVWFAGRAVESSAPVFTSAAGVAAGSLEFAGAAALLLGVLAALRTRLAPATDLLGALHRLAARVEPRWAAAALAAAVGGFGVLGTAVYTGAADAFMFDLNDERNLPAAFSGALQLAAAALALLAGRIRLGGAYVSWLVLAGVLAFLAVDEVGAVHDAIQSASGVFGQAFYTPVLLLWAAVWAVTFLCLKRTSRDAAALYVGGPVAWLASQVADVLYEPDAGRDSLPFLIVPEELLEMVGSGFLVLALLVGLRRLAS